MMVESQSLCQEIGGVYMVGVCRAEDCMSLNDSIPHHLDLILAGID